MPRLSTLWASIGSSAPIMRHIICRISATETGAVLAAISRASARAVGSNSSAGTTLLTRRPASASCAGKTRPVKHHSSACEMPTMRGRNQLEAASGTMPRWENKAEPGIYGCDADVHRKLHGDADADGWTVHRGDH